MIVQQVLPLNDVYYGLDQTLSWIFSVKNTETNSNLSVEMLLHSDIIPIYSQQSSCSYSFMFHALIIIAEKHQIPILKWFDPTEPPILKKINSNKILLKSGVGLSWP